MICIICRQAEAREGMTSIVLERGEIKIVINHVPAYVCPGCGEAYVDEAVAARVLSAAEEKAVAGDVNAVGEYEPL